MQARRRHAHRILLGEDDEEMRALVASVLRDAGYEVIEEADGRGLLRRIAEATRDEVGHFDLVVADVQMAACSGKQVLEALHRAGSPPPVVLMTPFGHVPTRQQLEAMGAILIDKPFDLDALLALARTLLDRERAPAVAAK